MQYSPPRLLKYIHDEEYYERGANNKMEIFVEFS